MRKYWFLALFLALFATPALVGCGGGQVSQDSAREQFERDQAEEAAEGDTDEDDEPGDDE